MHDSFLDITIGTVFSEEYIHEFIKKLQINEGQQMKLFENENQLSIECSNNYRQTCSFVYLFTKKIDIESHQMGYQVFRIVSLHSPYCKINDQTISFERNQFIMKKEKDLIKEIMLQRYKQFGPENPKTILQIVSQKLGFEDVFINKGIRDPLLKRKIKKKFDNVVAHIRKENQLQPTCKENITNIRRFGPHSVEREILQLTEDMKIQFDDDLDEQVDQNNQSPYAPNSIVRSQHLKELKKKKKEKKLKQKRDKRMKGNKKSMKKKSIKRKVANNQNKGINNEVKSESIKIENQIKDQWNSTQSMQYQNKQMNSTQGIDA